jgi:hypothetical protein
MTVRVCAPDIFSGDAVGNHCIGFVRMAKRLGLQAKLYAKGFDAGTSGAQPLEALFASVTPEDTRLYDYEWCARCSSVADCRSNRSTAGRISMVVLSDQRPISLGGV